MKNIELLQVERLLIKLKSFFTPSFLKTLKLELLNFFRTNSRLLFAYSVILFLLFSQEDFILALFDKYVLILPEFKTTLLSSLFFLTSLIYVIYRFWVLWKNRFVISSFQIILCSVLLIIYSYYRIHNIYIHEYVYFPRNSFIAYLDVISFLLLVFWLITGISYLKNLKAVDIKKTQAGITPGEFNGYIEDQPISDSKYDLLDYTKEVTDLAEKLKSIPFGSSCSIGIIASWGSGKSSYLNLLRNCISDDDFIVVKFNPRHSKNAQNIQEYFFRILLSQLRGYGSEFSTLVKDYLKAIGIIDQNKFVSFIADLLSLNNDDDKKSKLNKAITLLPKRVLVFIEDFDRLLADEIIEVFKLIDGNASLNNIIFLTAYDKEHINKIIDEKYKNEDSFFSDKFFTWEISIPLRPYGRIYDYFVSSLLNGISIKIEEKVLYESDLKNHYDTISYFLPTFRDVKRFLNSYLSQYRLIKSDVEFEDYLLLYLIKYKYPNSFKRLFEKEYIKLPMGSDKSSCYVLKEKLNDDEEDSVKVDEKLFKVLSQLFSGTRVTQERSINTFKTFETYFYNRVYFYLEVKFLESLFVLRKQEAFLQLDEWIEQKKIGDAIEYLTFKNIFLFQTKAEFELFLEIVFYININYYDFQLHLLLLRLLDKQNDVDLTLKYQFVQGEYKQILKEKLEGEPNQYPHQFLLNLTPSKSNLEVYNRIIFSQKEILDIRKSHLSNYIELQKLEFNSLHLNLLYNCVESVAKNTHQIILAKDSCKRIRDLILKSPDYYIDNFVRLGMLSSNPEHNSIACEPFWNQIFKDTTDFEEFIKEVKVKDKVKLELVKTFWEIYKYNDYKPIEFHNQGNVEKKIQQGLQTESKMLREMLQIQSDLIQLKNVSEEPIGILSEETVGNLMLSCDKLSHRIDAIPLYIILNGSIKREIQLYKFQLIEESKSF